MASQQHITVSIWDQWVEDSFIDDPTLYVLCIICDKLYLLNKPVNELD